MDELLTSVNAEQVSDESSQIEQEVSESGNGEVATPQNDKPVQSAEENAKYAQVRREAEQSARTKALDEFIAKEGYTYNGQPITTYEEYQRIKAEVDAADEKAKFQEANGFDPDVIKPVVEQMLKSDPRYQRLEQMEREANITAAVSNFDKEFPELGVKTFDDIAKLPNIDKVYEYVNGKGLSLNDAYKLANYGDVIGKTAAQAQQEAIKKIAANGASSPGSLAAGGEGETFFTKEQVDKMSKADVVKNYDQIIKSTKKW
jgi:hypothetical protein